MTAVPPRSHEQVMTALEEANRIRIRRAALKADLKQRRVGIAELLSDPPEFVSTMKVFDLLRAVPNFGTVKATLVLRCANASVSKTVGGLSERQRRELVGLLA